MGGAPLPPRRPHLQRQHPYRGSFYEPHARRVTATSSAQTSVVSGSLIDGIQVRSRSRIVAARLRGRGGVEQSSGYRRGRAAARRMFAGAHSAPIRKACCVLQPPFARTPPATSTGHAIECFGDGGNLHAGADPAQGATEPDPIADDGSARSTSLLSMPTVAVSGVPQCEWAGGARFTNRAGQSAMQ